MAVAATIRGGGRIIDTWVENCPHCSHEVAVPESDAKAGAKLRCSACRKRFRAQGPAEAGQVALDTPTRVAAPKQAAPSDPKDSLVGTTLGRWTLLRLIGRGGMGRVYEARDCEKGDGEKGRRVALKVLGDELATDRQFAKRFRREARHLSSLSHPHIVNVVDEGRDDDRLWFAMDYVRGESLRRLIERGTLDPKRATEIASQVSAALGYAHDRGIIHRDLKPENVLLDEDGTVHLVDFGLSRLVNTAPGEASTRLTRTDVILGTYEYMAPEQRRGDRSLDGRADIFALGVILYEMLTGTLPLGRFTPPSETSRQISRSFDEVINRALATDPEARFNNAALFEEALERALVNKTPTPPPPPLASSPPAPVVPHHRVDEARSILKHVEILGALDRVGGILFLLGGLGLFSLTPLVVDLPWIPSMGGLLAIILGFYLLGLGKRVARLDKGAREGQITVSILMLFFPPFLMALGIYGLIVMTSERARDAFRYGKKALQGPEPIFEVLSTESVVEQRVVRRAEPASFLMRAFSLLAIFYSLYVGVVALDVFADTDIYSSSLSQYKEFLQVAAYVALYSLAVVVWQFLHRKRRRGLGLAVITSIILFAAMGLLLVAVNDAQYRRNDVAEQGSIEWSLPRGSFRHPLRPFVHWETPK